MADYTDYFAFSRMLHDFCKYVPINKKTFCQRLKIEETEFDAFVDNVDLLTLTDKQIYELQALIFNKLNKDTFDIEVKDDEVEYCWHLGFVLLRQLDEEFKRRHPKDESFVRNYTK